MQGHSLAIDRPVWIAFYDLAIAVTGFRATARVVYASQRLTHYIGLCSGH